MEKQQLTEEELDRLKKSLSPESYAFYERQFGNQLGMFPEYTKLVDCPVELTFNLSINALEQDSEGHNIGSVGLSNYTFHIPVPTGHNHEKYIETFLNHFEQAIMKASDKTEEEIISTKKESLSNE
jgi:hypothetical protein